MWQLSRRATKGTSIITIAIVVRNTLLRTGLEQLLARVVPDVTLQGFGYADLERVAPTAFPPDVLLLSIASPERLGSLVAASIKVFTPKRIIVMAEGFPDPGSIETLPLQVVGYIDKSSAPDVFINGVRRVLDGHTCFPWPVTGRVGIVSDRTSVVAARIPIRPPAQPISVTLPADASAVYTFPTAASRQPEAADIAVPNEACKLGLTPRQYAVLVLLSRGLSLKAVARELDISLGTAKAHTEAMYQRLGAHNRNEAVYIAHQKGARLLNETSPQEGQAYA